MTEFELTQLPATEADEDSQQIPATRGDVRRIFREEIETAVSGLVSQTHLDEALKHEHSELTRHVDERIRDEAERRIAAINAVEQSQREHWRELRESVQRIEQQISNALTTWTTTVQAVASTNTDNSKRIGDLEKVDDVQGQRLTAVDNRITDIKETFASFVDDVSRRMEAFTGILLGNEKSGQISLGQRIDRIVGTSQHNEERLEIVEDWVLAEKKRREQFYAFMTSRVGGAAIGGGGGLILAVIGKILFGG